MTIQTISRDISKGAKETCPQLRFPLQWRNGIIVRMPNHLGDAVMALPALTALRRIIPAHCALFVITPANIRQLYDALDEVDDVIALPDVHRFWNRETRKEIRRLRPGIALMFNHSLRDAISLKLAGIPQIFGEAWRGRSCLLTQAFHLSPHVPGDPGSPHQTMRYLAAAAAFGTEEWNGSMPQLHPRSKVDELAIDLSGFCRHPQMLILAPGAAYGSAKRWSDENFGKVGMYWIRHGGIVVLLGSGSERSIGDLIAQRLPAAKCFNLCGKTDLFALMHLFQAMALMVANDSGLMHLAAAMGKPGIAVFGPTDSTDTGPLSPKWKLISSPVPCAPCLARSCPQKSSLCMKNITAAAVIRELRKSITEYKLPFRKTARHDFR